MGKSYENVGYILKSYTYISERCASSNGGKENDMDNKQKLVETLNEQMDECIESRNYKKLEEVSRELCQLQGLDMVEKMPDDFVLQIKRREKEKMRLIKRLSKHVTKIAAAFAVALVAGGIASAAFYYNSGVNVFKYGLSTGEVDTDTKSQFDGVKLPEGSNETKVIEEERGDSSHIWTKKKVWKETRTQYESDDAVNWKDKKLVDRYTQYSYDNYFAAAEENDFAKVFRKDYSGSVSYQKTEHLKQDAETDYTILGKFSLGNGIFTFEQQKEKTENTKFVLITGDTSNEREYVSSSGYAYKLADDKETGKTRTNVVVPCNDYRLIFSFTGMSDDEIHEVLENIDIENLVDLSKK